MLLLCVVSVFALSAVAAASASAFTKFEAEKYPVKLKAQQSTENVFQVGSGEAGKVSCKKATFESGEYTAATESVKVKPAYSECTVFTVVGGEVKMNGCEYELFANESREGGDVKILCPTGKKIEVTAASCTVSVGSQALGGAGYANLATSPTAVEVKSAVTKIKYESNGLGVCPANGQEATYNGNVIAKGFNPAAESEQIGIKAS
jgi:hypothetical protein